MNRSISFKEVVNGQNLLAQISNPLVNKQSVVSYIFGPASAAIAFVVMLKTGEPPREVQMKRSLQAQWYWLLLLIKSVARRTRETRVTFG